MVIDLPFFFSFVGLEKSSKSISNWEKTLSASEKNSRPVKEEE